MTTEEPDIFNIDVDADDYAEAAAGDVPSVDRTYQSREEFEKIRTSYTAKHDNGNHKEELLKQMTVLRKGESTGIILDKRQQMLVGYAVGELYYDHKYMELLELIDHIEQVCKVQGKMQKSLAKWRAQAEARCQ